MEALVDCKYLDLDLSYNEFTDRAVELLALSTRNMKIADLALRMDGVPSITPACLHSITRMVGCSIGLQSLALSIDGLKLAGRANTLSEVWGLRQVVRSLEESREVEEEYQDMEEVEEIVSDQYQSDSSPEKVVSPQKEKVTLDLE